MPNQTNHDEVKAARERIDATARAIAAAWEGHEMSATYKVATKRCEAAYEYAEELERARAESIKRVEGRE